MWLVTVGASAPFLIYVPRIITSHHATLCNVSSEINSAKYSRVMYLFGPESYPRGQVTVVWTLSKVSSTHHMLRSSLTTNVRPPEHNRREQHLEIEVSLWCPRVTDVTLDGNGPRDREATNPEFHESSPGFRNKLFERPVLTLKEVART